MIPPAVEPGLPPINMSTAVKNLLPSVSAAVSTVLKPAVLGVTALNRQARNFSDPVMPTRIFPRSII